MDIQSTAALIDYCERENETIAEAMIAQEQIKSGRSKKRFSTG